MRLLAIDPGNIESAFTVIDSATRKPVAFAKTQNQALLESIQSGAFGFESVWVEMVACYGMPVGREVFDTAVWIGRFTQAALTAGVDVHLAMRLDVKLHHCHDSRAKDANITRALVDRFACGQPNFGKGTKSEPGWFYGFSADVWQAYALAVYAADALAGGDVE